MTQGQLRGKNACQSYLVTQIPAPCPRASRALRTGQYEFSVSSNLGARYAKAASELRPRFRRCPCAFPLATTFFEPKCGWPWHTLAASNSDGVALPAAQRRSGGGSWRIFDKSFFLVFDFIAG